MRDRPGGMAGLVGAALNVAAVVALTSIPHAWQPDDISAWWAEAVAARNATLVSSWAFTFGLVALAAFAVAVARRSQVPLAATASTLFAGGALLDAAGTLGPVAALDSGAAAGAALLRLSLLLDSAFNGLLGVALILFASVQTTQSGWPRGLRWLGLIAGVASLPVTLQFWSPTFAALLKVAGPLWLAWVAWTSVELIRGPRA